MESQRAKCNRFSRWCLVRSEIIFGVNVFMHRLLTKDIGKEAFCRTQRGSYNNMVASHMTKHLSEFGSHGLRRESHNLVWYRYPWIIWPSVLDSRMDEIKYQRSLTEADLQVQPERYHQCLHLLGWWLIHGFWRKNFSYHHPASIWCHLWTPRESDEQGAIKLC